MLVSRTDVPVQTLHKGFADVTNQASGTGYTTGGAALASKTVTQDNTKNRSVLDAASTNFSSSTFTACSPTPKRTHGSTGN